MKSNRKLSDETGIHRVCDKKTFYDNGERDGKLKTRGLAIAYLWKYKKKYFFIWHANIKWKLNI